MLAVPRSPASASNTKFFNSCSTGRADAVVAFIDSGLDPESRDAYFLTGLIWAARKGRVAVAEVLLSSGAQIEARDRRGRTALFHAVAYKRYEFVEFLARRGANISPVDTNGWSPLDCAGSSGHKKMVRLLESIGGRSGKSPTGRG